MSDELENDVISRKAVIEMLTTRYPFNGAEFNSALDEAVMKIRELPSLRARPQEPGLTDV